MADKGGNVSYEGLDPEVKSFLEEIERAAPPPLSRETYMNQRRFVDAMAGKTPRPPHGLRKIEDMLTPVAFGEVPVRIYVPEGDGPLPVLVFCHGGGWVVGGLAMEEHVCLALSERTPCVVVSVDYRLAPEHPFPAALTDVYHVFRWIADNAATFGGDGKRIAVSGESAGANLVTAAALLSKEKGGPKAVLQVLINPVTDLTGFHTRSHNEFRKGFVLTRADMEAVTALYVPDGEDRANPLISPLLARDLSGLPPALIITSKFDPLRDEGEAYAKRLMDAGVPVTLNRYDDTIHAFLYFVRSSGSAKRALTEISAGLRKAFGG